MAKKREFYFKSRDGINKVHAVEWRPDKGDAKAVLQIVHGMAEHIDRYDDFAGFMTDNGFIVVGMDNLGHGLTASTKEELGYFAKKNAKEYLVNNAHILKKQIEGENPELPYFFMGHSMGSYITRKYISTYGAGIDGCIIVGTGFESKLSTIPGLAIISIVEKLNGERYRSTFLDNAMFGAYSKRISNPSTSFDWICTDETVVKEYIDNPLDGVIFTVNGFKTLVSLVDEVCSRDTFSKTPVDLPMLLISGSEDPVGNYGKGVKKSFDCFKSAGIKDVKMKLYPGMRHEIINETGKMEVYKDILNWLDTHIEK